MDIIIDDTGKGNIGQVWALFKRPGAVVEVRALLREAAKSGMWEGFGATISGYYDNPAAFERDVLALDKSGRTRGIYHTLNPVSVTLLARANNRLIAVKQGDTTTDKDVVCRRWLLVDFDPVRPAGISATDAEKAAARERMEECRRHLAELGWPACVVADSSNGPHLLFAIDLPNDEPSKQLIANVLKALSLQFGDDVVAVDTGNYNAARITKAYGTLPHKGDPLPERPHRRSQIESIPKVLTPVTLDQLTAQAIIWTSYEKAIKAEKQTTAAGRGSDEAGQIWQLYNKAHPLEQMLGECGYKHARGNRWDDPRGGGSNGVIIDPEAGKGYACSSNDPMHNGHRFDSADLFVRYQHGGDAKAAYAAAKKELGLWVDAPKAHTNGNSKATATAAPKAEEPPPPPEEKEAKVKQSVQLYRLAGGRCELFTAHDDAAYAFVVVEGRRECHRLSSKGFYNFLSNLFYAQHASIPGASAVQECRALLEWDARHTRQEVYVRVAGCNGKIYIDLGGADWRAIEVDAEGWRIVERAPVAFRRSKGQLELPAPVAGGDLDTIRQLLNINPSDWPLVGAWMLSTLQPSGPYPVLCVVGEQGSAKSTAVRLLKYLLDPCSAGLRGRPEDIRDLMVAAANNWVMAYDNVSSLTNDVSDALCRLATGGGYATRSLYSDDEEFIIDATRPVVMNGITEIINRPDLLDRAIVIELPVLPAEKRRPEREYWAEIEAMRPAIFGALLDGLSYALGAMPCVRLELLPRMADFARFGVAAQDLFELAEGAGFLDLYNANRQAGTATIVESSILAGPLRRLVALDGMWRGSATELLEKLEQHATDKEKNSKEWPGGPGKLSGEMRRVAPALRSSGVVDVQHKEVAGKVRWTITRLNEG